MLVAPIVQLNRELAEGIGNILLERVMLKDHSDETVDSPSHSTINSSWFSAMGSKESTLCASSSLIALGEGVKFFTEFMSRQELTIIRNAEGLRVLVLACG